MKKFFAGTLAGAILATSVSAIAATGVVKTINASYSVNKLVVNGVDTGKGSTAFISGGTTYVPLRTVSDALNQDIKWDSATKTIYINSKGVTTGGPTLEEPTDLPSANSPVTLPSQPPVVTSPPVTQPPVGNGTWNGQKLVSINQAKNAAIKAVGGGNVIWEESDIYEQDDIPTYDFKIKKDNLIYEVEVNALTGVVIDFDID